MDRTILLLEMDSNYVPVAEAGCQPVEPPPPASITQPERVVEV